MAKLEFIKNNAIAGIFPIGSKIRKHFKYHRWPTTMKIAKYIECSREVRVIRSEICSGDCAQILYKSKCGTTYCSRLGWRLIGEWRSIGE